MRENLPQRETWVLEIRHESEDKVVEGMCYSVRGHLEGTCYQSMGLCFRAQLEKIQTSMKS